MTLDQFYKLPIEDLEVTLVKLKLKYNLGGISTKSIKRIARNIRNGFRPYDLKQYLYGVDRRGRQEAIQESDNLYNLLDLMTTREERLSYEQMKQDLEIESEKYLKEKYE